MQTFGDYLVFHPHLHVLAATGLYDREGRFHEIPLETLEPLAELFRHRFIANLLDKKIISERKARQMFATGISIANKVKKFVQICYQWE